MQKLLFCLLTCCIGYVPVPAQQPATTGILGAFGAETNLLLAQLQQKKEQVIQGTHFTEGILNGAHVVIAQTGIGKVNAAITTTLLIEHFTPARVLFTGIAGGVNPALSPGDLVIGTQVAYHDYGSLTADSMLHQPTRNPISFKDNPLYFPCDSQLVKLAIRLGKHLHLQKIGSGAGSTMPAITSGTIVTGDVFVSSATATEQLRKQMLAEATEMEGAAVAQTCWQQQVPFVVIRSLSDKANGHAATDVMQFYQIAAHNSAQLVIALAGELR